MAGWVERMRSHRRRLFLDLRDSTGIVQVILESEILGDREIAPEFVLQVEGLVQPRTGTSRSAAIAVEIAADRYAVLNPCRKLPFVPGSPTVPEAQRLRFRYLDLRTPRMREHLRLRHDLAGFVRRWFTSEGFLEVDTPLLVKATTGGAHEIAVRTRAAPDREFVLAQSPQQLKQMLMIGGVERYFQIARCFRDEDPRSQRQVEFTEIDFEMAFVDSPLLMRLCERLLRDLIRRFLPHHALPDEAFPTLSYQEALSRYGSEHPDTRYGLELIDLTPLVSCDSPEECVVGIRCPRARYDPSFQQRARVFEQRAREYRQRAPELVSFQTDPLRRAFGVEWNEQRTDALLRVTGATEDDLLLWTSGAAYDVHRAAGIFRTELASILGIIPAGVLACVFVTPFPLFWRSGSAWTSYHQPFTAPTAETRALIADDPARVDADEFEVVVNGVELGGGSLRIHERVLQEQVLRLIGGAEAIEEMRHLLTALEYGAPPHGGASFGFDSIVQFLAGAPNIREVLAFPKSGSGEDLLLGAPTPPRTY